ncbi:hypothetical protein [Thalassospira marina]|uniref:hypothetical protein n=1 Tax=Thalassospira marina TaxID=2048283 RepID=UPI0012FF4DE5|nr:hypothetical protein [Thalassospira marina]
MKGPPEHGGSFFVSNIAANLAGKKMPQFHGDVRMRWQSWRRTTERKYQDGSETP